MHGALHQNCADLKSTIQSVYQSWCMVHCGAFKVYQNCADLKLKDLQSKITLILVASVLYSSCPVHCPIQVP